MRKEFRLEELWTGNGYRKLWASAWNGEFGGATDVFVSIEKLAAIAELLNNFPNSPADTRTATLGEVDPSHAGGVAELKFSCVDSAGHVGVELKIESRTQDSLKGQNVSLVASVDPSDLARFATELRMLNAGSECASLRINHTRPMEATGENGEFHWLLSKHLCLGDLLRCCPQAMVGKFLAITSFDSGHFVPNEAELAKGWKVRGGIAYSPRVENAESLPYDGYDEWYLSESAFDLGALAPMGQNPFDPQTEPSEVQTFVNFGGFAIDDGDSEVTKLFWKQTRRVRPELYIADGDYLNIVCSDVELFAQINRCLRRLRPS